MLVLALGTVASPAHAADRAHATVVELFTAQGCAACPPAQANLNAIADRPDLVPLSFAVTYWDALGWQDRFARPAFTARQRDYARVAARRAATPQVVLNGTFAIIGQDREALDRAIARADRDGRGPAVVVTPRAVAIGAGARPPEPATVWLVRYDPRTLAVRIGGGENAGRTLPHRNVVRALAAIGTWDGTARRIALAPSPDPEWRIAVLVQSRPGGTILSAGR